MHNVLIIFYIAFSIGNLFILPELGLVSALSVLSAGLSPAPDYFSAGSTWQAFEPSYAHFT